MTLQESDDGAGGKRVGARQSTRPHAIRDARAHRHKTRARARARARSLSLTHTHTEEEEEGEGIPSKNGA
jgi:hypothetical protein